MKHIYISAAHAIASFNRSRANWHQMRLAYLMAKTNHEKRAALIRWFGEIENVMENA